MTGPTEVHGSSSGQSGAGSVPWPWSEQDRHTLAAWQQFAAGDNDESSVAAAILRSWHRGRDRYSDGPREEHPHWADTPRWHTVALTQLGGIAATLSERFDGTLTAVTDAEGRVLGTWGNPAMLRRATDGNLPLPCWARGTASTNGMDTETGETSSRRADEPRHRSASSSDWACRRTAVCDPLTDELIGALSVARWKRGLAEVDTCLEQLVAPVHELLVQLAVQAGLNLVDAFDRVAHSTTDPVLALDIGGNVVIANEQAHRCDAELPIAASLHPAQRRRPESAELRQVVWESLARARLDPDWIGTCQLSILPTEHRPFTLQPIAVAHQLIGIVLRTADAPSGEPVGNFPEHPEPKICNRIMGLQDSRIIVLQPQEIRYAQADKHAVWLVTDRGRLRAAHRGLDNTEHELSPFGFLRIHRSYLVNVRRIREIEQGFGNGTFTVSTQHHGREALPVARRHAARLREQLGI